MWQKEESEGSSLSVVPPISSGRTSTPRVIPRALGAPLWGTWGRASRGWFLTRRLLTRGALPVGDAERRGSGGLGTGLRLPRRESLSRVCSFSHSEKLSRLPGFYWVHMECCRFTSVRRSAQSVQSAEGKSDSWSGLTHALPGQEARCGRGDSGACWFWGRGRGPL